MLLLNFFKRKIRFFAFHCPVSDMFFLVIGIIFSLFSVLGEKFFSPFSSFSYFSRGFSKEKSSFFGMNFPPERTFFPFLGEYFRIFFVSSDKESHPSRGIFRPIRQEFSPFRLFFARTRRAHTCTRVIMYWVPLPASFSFFRKTCRKTYLKHSILWIFLQKVWKKVWVKVGESEKVRNFAPAFERERRWRDDNLKGNGAGSSGSAAVQVSYLNGVKGARTAAGRSQLPPPKKTFWKKLSKKFGGFEKSS